MQDLTRIFFRIASVGKKRQTVTTPARQLSLLLILLWSADCLLGRKPLLTWHSFLGNGNDNRERLNHLPDVAINVSVSGFSPLPKLKHLSEKLPKQEGKAYDIKEKNKQKNSLV